MAHDISSKHPVRNNTIDVAKGLGIILVVFGHNWIVLHDKGELFRVIYSFHMPLFFFLSGIYIKESEAFGSYFRSKADALLKPYFVVLLVIGLTELFKGKDLAFNYLAGVMYAVGSTIVWPPLWFLPHLLISSALIWLVINLVGAWKQKNIVFISIVLVFLVLGAQLMAASLNQEFPRAVFSSKNMVGGQQILGLPFSLDLALVTSAYGLMGYLSREYVRERAFNPILFGVSILVFVGLHYYYDETMDLNLRIYGNVFISSFQAISGIFLLLELSRLISRFRALGGILSYIGVSSLFILIFHAWAQGRFFYSGLNFVQNRYFLGVAALVAGVVLPIVLLEIFKRKKFISDFLLPRKYSISK